MACFKMCSMPALEEEEPLIVDVNKILSDKAWNNFIYSFGYFHRKCLKRSNFTIDVPENYFVYERIEQSVTKPGRGIKTTPTDTGGDGASPKDMLQGKTPTHRSSNPEAISIDTVFNNDTAEKQTYQFKFSKTRTTRVEVSYQKGFTIGGKASFSVGIPKVLSDGSVGLEAEMQYEVTKSEGQSFEESLNMEATSEIFVGPKSNYVANVQLEERNVHVHFQVRTRMSMPQGRAPIYIKKKKCGTVVFVYSLKNLKDAFVGTAPCVEKVVDGDKVATDKVDFVIDGVIKGSLACDHRINLTSDETEDEKNMAKRKRLMQSADED